MKNTTTKIYFDGATGPTNPGHGGIGFIVIVEGESPKSFHHYLGPNRTNNECEYAALIYALTYGISLGIEQDRVEVYGDSKLVVSQVNQPKVSKGSKMKNLTIKAKELLDRYTDCMVGWVPREENSMADKASTKALTSMGIEPFNMTAQYKRYK